MAGSIATDTHNQPPGRASSWAQGLGRVFRRVAIFDIDGTQARVASVHGMGPPRLGAGLSLVDETPLRWAVAAASPIVGAGAAPGGAAIAAAIGLSTPRAYAVIPLATGGASSPSPMSTRPASRSPWAPPASCSPSATASCVMATSHPSRPATAIDPPPAARGARAGPT